MKFYIQLIHQLLGQLLKRSYGTNDMKMKTAWKTLYQHSFKTGTYTIILRWEKYTEANGGYFVNL